MQVVEQTASLINQLSHIVLLGAGPRRRRPRESAIL